MEHQNEFEDYDAEDDYDWERLPRTESVPSLFPTFVLSLVILVVVPWTFAKLFGNSPSVKSSWTTARLAARDNLTLLLLWAFMLILGTYVNRTAVDNTFDVSARPSPPSPSFSFPMLRSVADVLLSLKPFQILSIPTNADDKTVRQAYRKLAKQFHPDKNPDPAAAIYFAEKIAKAYKTLTDEVARENW